MSSNLTIPHYQSYVYQWDQCVTFLGLRRVHFSFSTCLLSLSHHVTNHPSISITHMTSHMPFQSPAPQSYHVLYHLLPSHLRITWYSLTWSHMTLSLPLTRLYSITSASLPDSRPVYYTFLIASFYDSYWLLSCYLHAWVSSAVYDSIFWTMTRY